MKRGRGLSNNNQIMTLKNYYPPKKKSSVSAFLNPHYRNSASLFSALRVDGALLEETRKKSGTFTSGANEGRRNVRIELFIKLTPQSEIELLVSDPDVCVCMFPSTKEAEEIPFY